jgi:hypothetical protein
METRIVEGHLLLLFFTSQNILFTEFVLELPVSQKRYFSFAELVSEVSQNFSPQISNSY